MIQYWRVPGLCPGVLRHRFIRSLTVICHSLQPLRLPLGAQCMKKYLILMNFRSNSVGSVIAFEQRLVRMEERLEVSIGFTNSQRLKCLHLPHLIKVMECIKHYSILNARSLMVWEYHTGLLIRQVVILVDLLTGNTTSRLGCLAVVKMASGAKWRARRTAPIIKPED